MAAWCRCRTRWPNYRPFSAAAQPGLASDSRGRPPQRIPRLPTHQPSSMPDARPAAPRHASPLPPASPRVDSAHSLGGTASPSIALRSRDCAAGARVHALRHGLCAVLRRVSLVGRRTAAAHAGRRHPLRSRPRRVHLDLVPGCDGRSRHRGPIAYIGARLVHGGRCAVGGVRRADRVRYHARSVWRCPHRYRAPARAGPLRLSPLRVQAAALIAYLDRSVIWLSTSSTELVFCEVKV